VVPICWYTFCGFGIFTLFTGAQPSPILGDALACGRSTLRSDRPCCRMLQIYMDRSVVPQGHGPFFWWNMGLQTDEHWRYMDIFRLTLNGNGYIGTFPSLFGCQSMTCPVFLAHCPISNSGFWLGTCSDMISCLIYCGKPTHKESQTSLQIWIHRHTQKSNPD